MVSSPLSRIICTVLKHSVVLYLFTNTWILNYHIQNKNCPVNRIGLLFNPQFNNFTCLSTIGFRSILFVSPSNHNKNRQLPLETVCFIKIPIALQAKRLSRLSFSFPITGGAEVSFHTLTVNNHSKSLRPVNSELIEMFKYYIIYAFCHYSMYFEYMSNNCPDMCPSLYI